MAFFNLFNKLNFFAGRSTEGLQEEDLDFQKWIAAHRNWRRRLLDFIDGNSSEALDAQVIGCDDRCDLGRWIHGNGHKFYGNEATFKRLVGDHAAFHRSAGSVVSQFKQGDEKEARRTLNGDFDRHSMHVVSALETLEKQVRQ